MNALILISIALAPAPNMENSYTFGAYVSKNYNGAPYVESTVNCKAGMLKYPKTITYADAGFGIKAYYVGVVPYVDSSNGAVLRSDGRINTADAAANKACFG